MGDGKRLGDKIEGPFVKGFDGFLNRAVSRDD